MEKIFLKRIVAREWLIFVGSVFLGIIGFLIFDYLNEIQYQRELSKGEYNVSKLLEETKKHEAITNDPLKDKKASDNYLPPGAKGDMPGQNKKLPPGSIENIFGNKPIAPGTIENILGNNVIPLSPMPIRRSVPELLILLPYAIVQFARSLVWSIKNRA